MQTNLKLENLNKNQQQSTDNQINEFRVLQSVVFTAFYFVHSIIDIGFGQEKE